jgi:hypothetical protein
MRPSTKSAVFPAELPYYPKLHRIWLLRGFQRFKKVSRVLSPRKQGQSAWSSGHDAVLLMRPATDADSSSSRLVASPELTGDKGHESLTEVFGPLGLIPQTGLRFMKHLSGRRQLESPHVVVEYLIYFDTKLTAALALVERLPMHAAVVPTVICPVDRFGDVLVQELDHIKEVIFGIPGSCAFYPTFKGPG